MSRTDFTGFQQWRWQAPPQDSPARPNPPPAVPTYSDNGVTARIHWRPVAKAAWELVRGEYGLCSMPRFDRADRAKEDAWEHLADLP